MIRRQYARPVVRLFEEVRVLDPRNPGISLDEGQMITSRDPERAKRILGRALEEYPTNLELLHWYAHAMWADSWETSEEIIQLILPYKPQDGDVLYDLACTRSRAGDLDESEKYLRRAIESGFTMFGHMEVDPDLRNLRKEGRLSRVLRDYR
jgi:tetratricopeptide (TPR) repeat protein